jgi:hypothetical protein
MTQAMTPMVMASPNLSASLIVLFKDAAECLSEIGPGGAGHVITATDNIIDLTRDWRR